MALIVEETCINNIHLLGTVSRIARRAVCKTSTARYSTVAKPHYPRRVFSGIQPTGVPHIGNYYGAIKPWVDMQDSYGNVILSVVDMHAITMPGNDPDKLRQNIHEMFASLIACGIDPEKTILFQQSAVSKHAELGWILGCLTTMPRLQHLPQWKQKSEAMSEVPLGVFTYPVLQSADILLYKATDVPVGDDQVKHIELARDLANLFNHKFGETFPKPRPVVGSFNRIKSLRSPTSKMSKSEKDAKSRIDIIDSPDVIREKLKKAVTDFTSKITYEPTERPGVSNLLSIHAAFVNSTPEEICKEISHLDTLQYKMLVADVIIEGTAKIREKFAELMQHKDYLEQIVQMGNNNARQIAEKTYKEVIHRVGFV